MSRTIAGARWLKAAIRDPGQALLAVLDFIWTDATRLRLLVTLSYERQRSSHVGPPSLSDDYIHLYGGTLPTSLA